MSTRVVRLFLGKDVELPVREALKKLNVQTIEKQQSPNGSQVVNVFDQNSSNELISTKPSGIEQGVLLASEDAISQDLDKLYYDLKGKGIQLLGILDISKSNWQILFKTLLLG
jgi:hypothetical protein